MFPDNAVLLESLGGREGFGCPKFFCQPRAVIRADSINEVPEAFVRAECYRRDGYYVAGYVAYEAGYAFEERLAHLPVGSGPLVWFGVYGSPIVSGIPAGDNGKGRILPDAGLFHPLVPEYRLAIAEILEYIAQGDVYQINYTGHMPFRIDEDPYRVYHLFRQRQQTGFSAYIRQDTRHILSLSPELFFRVSNGTITVKPMKGTARRGRTLSEDEQLAEQLRNCPKNRAENTMIVDLLRNDLGRVCRTGSVKVASLFDIERYETLHQMTSTITGELRGRVGLPELFRSLFPCGSVTGAPKVRAMEIIRELEQSPRGIYTGAIGYAAPNGDMLFNVAIRTLVIENGAAMLGIGSGIVADSEADAEYQECLLKAEFLSHDVLPRSFRIIETMRFQQGWPLLHLHLERLRSSADYFGFPCDTDVIRKGLFERAALFSAGAVYKVRLLLSPDGSYSVEDTVLHETQEYPVRIAVSPTRVSSGNIFQYHKTTNRDVYAAELKAAQNRDLFDLLFLNERSELTEGCITNVFIERGGRLFTPPVSSGLLGGVWRRHVLETHPDATESVLTLDDLRTADRTFVCNAVRGMMPAVVIGLESSVDY